MPQRGDKNKAVQTIPYVVKTRRLRPYHRGHDLHSRPYHMGAIPPEPDPKERLYYELSRIKRPIRNGPHNCLFARFCSTHEHVVLFFVRPGCVFKYSFVYPCVIRLGLFTPFRFAKHKIIGQLSRGHGLTNANFPVALQHNPFAVRSCAARAVENVTKPYW